MCCIEIQSILYLTCVPRRTSRSPKAHVSKIGGADNDNTVHGSVNYS